MLEEVLSKDLVIPHFTGRKKEWPTAKAKARKRHSMRAQVAREAQQQRDKRTMKGVV